MKKVFTISFLVLSLQGFAQCTECTTLAEALKKPESVKSLTVNGFQSGVRLDSIPTAIGQLINCQILYLSDHNIQTVPAAIGKLQQLKELSLAGCKLEKLPDEVFTLKKLKEIILFDNLFSESYIKEIKQRFASQLPKVKVML